MKNCLYFDRPTKKPRLPSFGNGKLTHYTFLWMLLHHINGRLSSFMELPHLESQRADTALDKINAVQETLLFKLPHE